MSSAGRGVEGAIGQLARFSVAGAIGFAIDAGILTALVTMAHVSVYPARAVSFGVAVFVTWLINRRWTFRTAGASRGQSMRLEYVRYLLVQVSGAVTNLGVFAALLAAYPALLGVPVVPLAIGAIAGLAVNFAGSRLLVFTLHDA